MSTQIIWWGLILEKAPVMEDAGEVWGKPLVGWGWGGGAVVLSRKAPPGVARGFFFMVLTPRKKLGQGRCLKLREKTPKKRGGVGRRRRWN